MAYGRPEIEALIESEARKHGLPPALMKRLAQVESGMNPMAQSPKGAYGIMQLMPETARGLGVDPRDVGQNIAGGTRYFAKMLEQFRDP